MSSKFLKAFSNNHKLEKDEILDFVFWCRQIIALAFGVGSGVLQFTGIYVIITFFFILFAFNKLLGVTTKETTK